MPRADDGGGGSAPHLMNEAAEDEFPDGKKPRNEAAGTLRAAGLGQKSESTDSPDEWVLVEDWEESILADARVLHGEQQSDESLPSEVSSDDSWVLEECTRSNHSGLAENTPKPNLVSTPNPQDLLAGTDGSMPPEPPTAQSQTKALEAKDKIWSMREFTSEFLSTVFDNDYEKGDWLSPSTAATDSTRLSSAFPAIERAGPLNQDEDSIYQYQPCKDFFCTSNFFRDSTFDLSTMWNIIDSDDFMLFVEQNRIENPTIDINPHVLGSDMLQAFEDEWTKCSSGNDGCDIRIVFHGSPSSSREDVLCNKLPKENGNLHDQGECFASSPVMPLRYACGGNEIVVFVVIASAADTHNEGKIILVEKPQRRLPLAILTCGNLEAMNGNPYIWKRADSFQVQLTKLRNELMLEVSQTVAKEKMIRLLLEREYDAASEAYLKSITDDIWDETWAQEVATYARSHIRDEDEIEIYFPNLPNPTFLSAKRCITTLYSQDQM